MHLPLTFGLLAALMAALVLLRIYWLHVPRSVRKGIIVFAVVVPLVFAIAYLTKWRVSSGRFNFAFCWALLASWGVWLVLLSRLRPRLLTGIIAVVLMLPVFSASILFPLSLTFDSAPATLVNIGDHIVSERIPWGTGTAETTGTDLTLYYQPAWMPLLRRSLRSARYYNGQCDANAAYAVLQPDHWHVEMVCPAASYLPADAARTITLPLARSMFHNPIKEAIPSSK